MTRKTILDWTIDVLGQVKNYGHSGLECNCGSKCEGTCTKAEVDNLLKHLQDVKKKNQQTFRNR